jgi:hypothetical protein
MSASSLAFEVVLETNRREREKAREIEIRAENGGERD